MTPKTGATSTATTTASKGTAKATPTRKPAATPTRRTAKPAPKPAAKPAANRAPKSGAAAPKAAPKEPAVKQPASKTVTATPAPKPAGKSAAPRVKATNAKATDAKATATKPVEKTAGKTAATVTVAHASDAASAAKKPPVHSVTEKESAIKARRRPSHGSVALVASGPGDPELLTLRAARLIAAADVIVVDADAVSVAQAHASKDAVVTVAVDSAGLPLDQAARSALVIEAAREGKATVRLIAGDPVIDGTLLHEAAALRKARIDFEVAPGVSEVTGVPAYAGFGLTGGRTRQVRIVDANDTDIAWGDLALPRITAVFIDGADRAADIATRLMGAGADASTPIAVTRRGTTVDQRTIVSTLGEIGLAAKAAKQAGRGLVVVGEIVSQREKLDWFEVKALFGCSHSPYPGPRRLDRRPAPQSRGRADRGADDLRRAAAHAAADRSGRARAGVRSLRVDRVHVGQRRPGHSGEAPGVRPRRPLVRGAEGRGGRRAHRLGAHRVRRAPGHHAVGRADHQRAAG
jgi:siroheme synthase